MNSVKFSLYSAGYCTASRAHVLRGSAGKTIRFYATYGLIKHPEKGYVLFDTGYTTRFYEHTKTFPFNLYAKATKVYVNEEDHVIYKLAKEGIKPSDIKYIIISHFHADHIGGLLDFPNAQFICTRNAYEDIRNRRGFSAVRRGFIPNLMPVDFEKRATLIDITKSAKTDSFLGKMYDLFADGSIYLYRVEGHARGQIGALLTTTEGNILLISDAAWLKENFENLHLPSPIVKLFFDSWSNYKRSLKNVHDYHKANPDTPIVPCHCETTYRKLTDDLVS
ncbi:MAG: MBL fold metallo-hydrolase [Marinoscillum sp.]